jgi:hypothetical protein
VLENAQEVYGIEVKASFDPAVVEVVDADPDKEGIQMVPGEFLKPDFLVRNTSDNQAGTLHYVITQVNPTPPVNGTGVVLSIQFLGKALGQQSGFTIDFVDIVDRRGAKLSVEPQDGALAIVPPKPPTPTPLPTASPVPTPAPATPQAAAAANSPGVGDASTQPDASAPSQARENNLVAQAAAMSDSEKAAIAGSLCIGAVGCLGAVTLLVVAILVLFVIPPKKNIKRRRHL